MAEASARPVPFDQPRAVVLAAGAARRPRPVFHRQPGGIAYGPGGWRPDDAMPYDSVDEGQGLFVDAFRVPGDALATDAAHDEGGVHASRPQVELVFWGRPWLTARNPSANAVTRAMGAILLSPYCSQLAQYGLHSIVLRGSTIVHNMPPTPTFDGGDAKGLVWDLIDQGYFPEPDEPGGNIIYLVVAPPESVYSDSGARGAHGADWDLDFFDLDWVWVGWSNWGDLDFLTDVLTHELVEAITDPRTSGDRAWVMNRSINGGIELGDACNNTAARVDGLLVQAYWSEAHKACVIPRHRYGLSIQSSTSRLSSTPIDEGTFTVAGNALCPGGSYSWQKVEQSEQLLFVAHPFGYAQPRFDWTLNDTPLSEGAGTISVPVDAHFPDVTGTTARSEQATVDYEVAGGTVTLRNKPSDGVYDVTARVTAVEQHPRLQDTRRTAETSGSLAGLAVELDPSYGDDRRACRDRLLAAGIAALEAAIAQRDRGDPLPDWIDTLPTHLDAELAAEVRELLALGRLLTPDEPVLAGELREFVYGRYGAEALPRESSAT